uniref:Alternative protein n=1 Tax=Macrostomum lignano TaxID=282301 RepID=A0A1I8H4B8_9PLAT
MAPHHAASCCSAWPRLPKALLTQQLPSFIKLPQPLPPETTPWLRRGLSG